MRFGVACNVSMVNYKYVKNDVQVYIKSGVSYILFISLSAANCYAWFMPTLNVPMFHVAN